MIVIPPVGIDASLLTSTTAVEPFTAAAFNGASTYGVGDLAASTDSDGDFRIWESLRPNNVGNQPKDSPLWWGQRNYQENQWDGVTTYVANQKILDGGVIWNSLQASNLNKKPSLNPDWWEQVGVSNKMAMFDAIRSTATCAASPLTITISPGERINALAVLGVVADTVRVQMTSGGVQVYDDTQKLVSRGATNFYDYCFKSFTRAKAKLFQSLPPYTNGVTTVTFTRAAGPVQCGALCAGKAHDLGITQPLPENDVLNYSVISRDDFGNATLNPRLSVPKTTQTVMADSRNLPDIVSLRSSLNAVPAVWAGLTDNSSDYFPPLLILGFYTQFKITLQKPSKAQLSLELQEVG